jgi:hypothetical protein
MNEPAHYEFDVFISYSSVDHESAQTLVNHLEQSGLKCWVAPRNIRSDQDYVSEVSRGLQRARVLVALISEHSQKSRHLLAEVKHATSQNKPTYFVRLEPVDIDDPLAALLSTTLSFSAFEDSLAPYWTYLANSIRGASDNNSKIETIAATPIPVITQKSVLSSAFIRIALYMLFGWWLLTYDPLGFGNFSGRVSEGILYNIAAPFYGKGAFGGPDATPEAAPVSWNKHISVMLFDDSALGSLNTSWPVSIDLHTKLLSDLYETYKPAAIMIDLSFIDRRDGQQENLEALRDLLLKIREEKTTTVYLAADSTVPKNSNILEELRDAATLAAVAWPAPHYAFEDPLYYPMAQRNTDALTATFEGPAYTIYRDLCLNATSELRASMHCPDAKWLAPDFHDPMQVVWGVEAPNLNWDQSNLGEHFNCKAVSPSLYGRLLAFADYKFSESDEEFLQTCPYAQLILVRNFMDPKFRAYKDVQEAYANALGPSSEGPKIIFYGAQLQGMEDSLYNYTHGKVAGVYLHAMALDNLLTFGRQYIRFATEEWKTNLINLLLLLAVATTSVILTDIGNGKIEAIKNLRSINSLTRKISNYWLGRVLLESLSIMAVCAVILTIMCVAFVIFRLTPFNWVGFWGMAGLFRVAESHGIEKQVQKIVDRFH